jgi:hypothetical protein
VKPRPLSERELDDWERWSGRTIQWKSEDVARLVATVRALQARVLELEQRLSTRPADGQPDDQSTTL